MEAYLLNLGTLAAIFALLASSLNIMMGYAGIFSVCHAAFFGVGAYAAATVALHVTPDVLVAGAFAAVCSAVLSLVIALPALRVRGEYFVISSLGLQIAAITVFSEAQPVTGGLGGLVGIPRPTVLGVEIDSQWGMFLTCVIALLCALALTLALMNGSFGRSLKAIRDNEVAARAIGKNVAVIKSYAVMLGCGLAGLAGALFAFQMSFVNVESFTLDQSMLITAMVIIGGISTVAGPIVGAVLLLLLPAALSFLPYIPPADIGSVQRFIYGLAMILLMIFRPAGIAGRKG
jgi:branched-chain amino acid transport system permease protein